MVFVEYRDHRNQGVCEIVSENKEQWFILVRAFKMSNNPTLVYMYIWTRIPQEQQIGK